MSCGKGEKKDARGTCRNYRHEYDSYQGKPEQIRHRAMRNSARATLAQSGLVRKGDGKEVDHRQPLDKGGSNARRNLQVLSRHANRTKGSK